MKFDDFFGFEDELLSVNACFTFFENPLSEVLAADWITKKQKNNKKLLFLLNFEHF